MARSASEFELDPAVVPILNGDATVSMDEWLAALSADESVSPSEVSDLIQTRNPVL